MFNLRRRAGRMLSIVRRAVAIRPEPEEGSGAYIRYDESADSFELVNQDPSTLDDEALAALHVISPLIESGSGLENRRVPLDELCDIGFAAFEDDECLRGGLSRLMRVK